MADENGLIAGHYRIDQTRPAPPLAGELRAYTVIDRRDPSQNLLAVHTRADLPARPRVSLARVGTPVPHAVLPLEYGTGRDMAGKPGWFVICDALPGPPVSQTRGAWREQDLIACVLLPAAVALAGLQSRGLTHRGINPENLFRAAGMQQLATLGPFWAAPPGSLQPAVFEPPYMASCLPAGRGDGSIADDVYALGVTLLALATGRTPLLGLDEDDILRRKVELGSYAALTADCPLPPMVSDLLRGMLAEDPEHRPSPVLLQRPEQARARRVAARPPRRAQLPLNIGGRDVWSARSLAHALGLFPDRAYGMLKSGAVEIWLRRNLGDPQLGMAVEDILRTADDPKKGEEIRQHDLVVLQVISAIDPLAPLAWRGFAVQPDGLGGALAHGTPEVAAALQDVVATEAVPVYVRDHARRQDLQGLADEARAWRSWLAARGPAGGLRRLIYGMNPMVGCASPLLEGHVVVRVQDLLPALNAAAAAADRTRPPIDAHIAAFVAARAEPALVGDLASIASFAGAAERLSVLGLFARLETRMQPGPLPGLAGWLLQSGFATLEDWRSRHRRAELEEAVKRAAAEGRIATMLSLVDDPGAKQADEAGAEAALARARALEAILADIEGGAPRRARAAQHLGHEFATGAGLLATLGAVISLALG